MKSDNRYWPKIELWCTALEVALEDVRGAARISRHVVQARHVICWLLREQRPQPSFPEIGRLLGNRDHTTIMHSARKVAAALEDRAEWAVDAIAACEQAVPASIELESPLETLRRCATESPSVHLLEPSGTVEIGEPIELAEVVGL